MDKFKSRKFIAMAIGTSLTALFTVMGLIFIKLTPSSSTAIVNLLTVSLATVNGSISVYALGQSAVDWKVNHSTTQRNERKEDIRYDMDYE